MMNEELKIISPDGYIIDKENSTFECIKFKKKQLTYKDIAKKLYKGKDCYWSIANNSVDFAVKGFSTNYANYINCVSKEQCKKLIALGKLLTVAQYLNGTCDNTLNCCIIYNLSHNKLYISRDNNINRSAAVYFRTEELAKQAINILGEETIIEALTMNI